LSDVFFSLTLGWRCVHCC